MNESDKENIKHGMLNTFAHELTHVAENSGFYEELHKAIIEAYENSGKSFDKLVEEKTKKLCRENPNAKNMSEEELAYLADVEVIADSCETMLKNSKIFEDIAQGNPTLAQKIKDKLKNFIARLKQLLNKTNALTHEGKLLEECVTEFENIQKLWDKAVTDGIKTANAMHAEQKNNTAENSDVRNQLRSTPEEKEIAANIKAVSNMKPVATLSGSEFSKSKTDLVTQVTDYFDEIGRYVNTEYGKIELTKSGVKSSIGHGIGRNKAIAFKAVPDVLKEGKIIDFQKNWKNRGYDTAVFAAPIQIADKDYFMAAVIVVETERNSYYLHEVAIQEKEDNTLFKTGTVKNGTSGKVLSSPIFTLLQKLQSVKNESEDNTEYQSRTSELDNEYLEAVKNNDMETAQRLVDEAAERAFAESKIRDEDGKLLKVYHGTPKDFTVFRNSGSGMYFTADPDYARGYTQLNGKVLKTFLNIKKPFDILNDSIARKIFIDEFIKGGYAQGIHPSSTLTEINKYIQNGVDWVEGDNLIEFLEENEYDYDGLIINEGSDSVATATGNVQKWRGYSYVTFNSEQIKSADPITYDDNGNVIPLSERFKNEKVDIRYQSRNTEADIDYSDLTTLDDEEIKVYNKRGWTRELFTAEDKLLLEEHYNLLLKNNNSSTYRFSDGSILTEVNNKMVVISGRKENPVIEAVIVINAKKEYEAEWIKELIYDEQRKFRYSKEDFSENMEFCEHSYAKELFKTYISNDYRYRKGYKRNFRRATLPSDFKSYGYTQQFHVGEGDNRETEQGISESGVEDDFPQFQMRPDGGYSNRQLLAEALESSAQNNVTFHTEGVD